MQIEWNGKGVEEGGVNTKTGETIVEVDPLYFRTMEVDPLCGDASRARHVLGWCARIEVQELFRKMVIDDLKHDSWVGKEDG